VERGGKEEMKKKSQSLQVGGPLIKVNARASDSSGRQED
jgi:hypothetical protein